MSIKLSGPPEAPFFSAAYLERQWRVVWFDAEGQGHLQEPSDLPPDLELQGAWGDGPDPFPSVESVWWVEQPAVRGVELRGVLEVVSVVFEQFGPVWRPQVELSLEWDEEGWEDGGPGFWVASLFLEVDGTTVMSARFDDLSGCLDGIPWDETAGVSYERALDDFFALPAERARMKFLLEQLRRNAADRA